MGNVNGWAQVLADDQRRTTKDGLFNRNLSQQLEVTEHLAGAKYYAA
jgi:hypothetical protein